MKNLLITSFIALGLGMTVQAAPLLHATSGQSTLQIRCMPHPFPDSPNFPLKSFCMPHPFPDSPNFPLKSFCMPHPFPDSGQFPLA